MILTACPGKAIDFPASVLYLSAPKGKQAGNQQPTVSVFFVTVHPAPFTGNSAHPAGDRSDRRPDRLAPSTKRVLSALAVLDPGSKNPASKKKSGAPQSPAWSIR